MNNVSWLIKGGYAYSMRRCAPHETDTNYPVGSHIWVDTVSDVAYVLDRIIEGKAQWASRLPDTVLSVADKQINVIGEAYSRDDFQYQDDPQSLGGVGVIINQAGGTGNLPVGRDSGDLIRYNAGTGAWESCAEPAEFKQINLMPREFPMEDAEGGVYYKSTDKSVYVCTED